MKVSELIAKLQNLPQDLPVMVPYAHDAEYVDDVYFVEVGVADDMGTRHYPNGYDVMDAQHYDDLVAEYGESVILT
jgi:hypothetical protein